MSGSTQVIKDFTTPDRPLPSSDHGEKGGNGPVDHLNTDKTKPVLVTPPESAAREELKKEDAHLPLQRVATEIESPDDRHVRFNKEMEKGDAKGETVLDSPSSTGSQRGLVSRRGGRCSSPGRNLGKSPSAKDNVIEVKAYRSPPRRKDDSDNVPSLCSANSMDKEKSYGEAGVEDRKDGPIVKKEDAGTSSTSEAARDRPVSISCDASINQTSPLTAAEKEKPSLAKSPKPKTEDGRKSSSTGSRKNNVTFSPVPPPKHFAERTPTKSPTGGRFHSLPTLDDASLASPGGIFLSPHPATPSYRSLPGSGSFDDADKDGKKPRAKDSDENDPKEQNILSPKTPRSPRTPRRDDRDRFLATPTDFAMDYGKPPNSGPFDSSNVLAWLQSPTANGLFSPGGLGSIMNTPRGGPRTPRTPTVSTSFFFSDVAGLPRSGDVSPKPGGEAGKRGGSQRGYSNIICISPLASSKAKNGSSKEANTPTINYKDMFASPAERNRGLSLMDKLPSKVASRAPRGSATKDPSIDAVHMAERDLMEDEDLSVLLQLASNTPRSTGEHPVAVSTSDGTHVFRSPNGRTSGGGGDESLPSLQLPVIGGRDSESNGTRLTRKTHSRDHGEKTDDLHRPLGMRPDGPSSSIAGYHPKSKLGEQGKSSGDKRKDRSKTDGSKKSKGLHPAPPPYAMPPHHYPHPDAPYYPPMPPGMAPHGSMRVVVGGPPPSRGSGSSGSPHGPASPHAPRPYPMPGDPGYPPPPYPPPGHYPHHPGVPPPPHMHPHYSHYPPPHHPPRPPHMPMYGAHPSSKSKTSKKAPKPSKQGTKRPSHTPVPKASSKKQKKSSPSGAPKKKTKSPQITDKAERQKAAATIQAVNAASGGKNDKAAALAAAILRGVTMRPSGKWQAQLYFAGKSRYIGVFDTREKAALAYEIAREKLKSEKSAAEGGTLTAKQTENAVNAARKAAFEGVNENDPRLASK